jgi:hypothetical protein
MSEKDVIGKEPMKRIEGKLQTPGKKFRLRLSRTGGLNAGWHPFRGVTLNSKHGLRVSKTFKGLTTGLQGGKLILRGRWSTSNGLLNTNLSKSGLSFSTKSRFGTYNWTNPNRSSFKFAGIQVRGKKAAGPAFIFALFAILVGTVQALIYLLKLALWLTELISRASWELIKLLARFSILLWFGFIFIAWDLPSQIYNNVKKRSEIDEP